MAKITVQRVQRKASGYGDPVRKYKVLVDGQEAGRVGAGKSISAEVEPGRHVVQLELGWCRSPAVSVEASSDEEVRLRCKPATNPLTAPFYVFFVPNRYIKLERC